MVVAPETVLFGGIKVTVAMPVLSVNRVLDGVIVPKVGSVTLKVTTAPATGAPAAFNTVAVTVAGALVEMEFTGTPPLVRAKLIVAVGTATVGEMPDAAPPVPVVVVAAGLPLPHPASRARAAAMIHEEKLKTL